MTVIKFYDAREGALSSDRPLNVAEIRNRTMEFVLSPGKVRLCPTKPALFQVDCQLDIQENILGPELKEKERIRS